MPDKTKKSDVPSSLEVEFLEALRRRCPSYQPILEALGHVYTRVGRFDEGLLVDLEMTRLNPADPEAWYNLACSHALTGAPEQALLALGKAISCGYCDAAWMESDPDLASLVDLPAFQSLLRNLPQMGGQHCDAGL